MDRFCPNCKTKLGDYDHFFCTSCGYTLEENLINRENVFKRVADFAASASDKPKKFVRIDFDYLKGNVARFFPPRIVIFLVLLLTVLSTGFYVYKHNLVKFPFLKPSKALELNSKASNTPKISANTFTSTLNIKTGQFTNLKLLENVPNDAKIVIVGQDLSAFSAIYSSFDKGYIELSEFLKDKTADPYVFFANTPEKSLDSKSDSEKYVWSLIVLPNENDISFSSELLDKYNWLRIWKNTPILLLTPSEYVLSQVAESKSGTAQNFTHTTFYASSKYLFSQEAKMLIYINDKEAQSYLNSILEKTKFSDDVRLILESVVKSKPGITVIK